jgi:hypothetical protein
VAAVVDELLALRVGHDVLGLVAKHENAPCSGCFLRPASAPTSEYDRYR